MAVKQTIAYIATLLQKENFISKFAAIVKDNEHLRDNYKIQFFDSPAKSNYLFKALNGQSINIMQFLSLTELEEYRMLKSHWQD